jgi:hypothetical protein
VWGIRPDGSNPCRHVERNPERGRAAVLNADESQLQSPARLAAGGAGQVLVTPARRADRCD